MRNIIVMLFLYAGCGSTGSVVKADIPTCPPVIVSNCSDQLLQLTDEQLQKGVSCPSNSRLVFPSGYYQSGKTVIMCQCKN